LKTRFIAGAAAQVSRQPIPDLFIGRVWIFFQQGLRRNQNAGGADAALQGGMVNEVALQRMQVIPHCQPLNRADFSAFGLNSKHQTRTDKAPIEGHAAGTAIACPAPLFCTGKPKAVAQHIQQRLVRRTDKFGLVTVHRGGNVEISHVRPPARL
jgi:hypothetical protein